MNPLLDVIKVLRHLPPQRLREEEGEGAGGDGHHGEDEGGDGGGDVGQRGHCGRQSPAHLGDQRGRAHARRPHCRGHQLAWRSQNISYRFDQGYTLRREQSQSADYCQVC